MLFLPVSTFYPFSSRASELRLCSFYLSCNLLREESFIEREKNLWEENAQQRKQVLYSRCAGPFLLAGLTELTAFTVTFPFSLSLSFFDLGELALPTANGQTATNS